MDKELNRKWGVLLELIQLAVKQQVLKSGNMNKASQVCLVQT